MIYFQIQTHGGKIIAGNMDEFSKHSLFENKRNFNDHKNGQGIKGVEKFLDDIKVWVVVESEADLLKSSKLFDKTIKIYQQVCLDIWKYHKAQIDAHAHILTTIQGQIRQKIEGFADDSQFFGDSFSESVQKISNIVKNNPDSASDLICYIQKRIADMRAHLFGVEIIHAESQYEIKPIAVSLRRAILNQCTPFLSELETNSVQVKFGYFLDESLQIEVDKNMFSLIMYNFFSNAAKYSKFESEIRLNFFKDQGLLDISMISLKMEQSELGKLSNEGVRGVNATSFPGKGIGLYVIQRALDLMGKQRMYIAPRYDRTFQDGNHTYVENHFHFYL